MFKYNIFAPPRNGFYWVCSSSPRRIDLHTAVFTSLSFAVHLCLVRLILHASKLLPVRFQNVLSMQWRLLVSLNSQQSANRFAPNAWFPPQVRCEVVHFNCFWPDEVIACVSFQYLFVFSTARQRRSQGGCWRGSSTPLSDQNIDVYFLVFHQHCTVSRDKVHCKMFFGSTTGAATHSLSNQAVMNFRDLRNVEAAFFIPACFALPYITRAGCCHALPVWKQAWRLMCSFYVTKLGPS